MSILNRKAKHVVIDYTVGDDGLRACDRQLVCDFQAARERGSAGCDYEALRTALRWARNHPGQLTEQTLLRAYNQAVETPVGVER